jgi:DNA helicase-2/ATP-dependent DNA helicase PcrA
MSVPKLSLDPDEIAHLRRVLNECDFTDAVRREFLECCETRHVQAVPGSGKTTLLVAKLALLARKWSLHRRGICVVSHTNAAREEVQRKFLQNSGGPMLLSYPHFIGTSTAFIHQFLALPLVRGMGWQVRMIDNDIFAAEALGRAQRDPYVLGQWLGNKPNTANKVISELSISPTTFKLQECNGLPQARSQVRPRLETLRQKLTESGLFRFEDLIAIADTALTIYPILKDRLAARFPLVFVDEAQDTPASHKRLIEQVFANSSVQWLGDCNQAIYDDGESVEGARWQPVGNPIELLTSKRFGPRTASFASRLTIAKPQKISGEEGKDKLHIVLLFDKLSITEVLPKFADRVCKCLGKATSGNINAWAVAAKHRIATTQAWPNRLGEYWTSYLIPRPSGHEAGTLLGTLKRARQHSLNLGSNSEALHLCAGAIINLLHRLGYDSAGVRLTPNRLWKHLDERHSGAGTQLRRVLISCLKESLPHSEDGWRITCTQPFVDALTKCIAIVDLSDEFLAFAPDTAQSAPQPSSISNVFLYEVGTVKLKIRVGTIASVKGHTHDATLVLETNEGQKMDVAEALRTAFLQIAPKGKQIPKALMNIFVASTRPRHVLGLATRRDAVDTTLEAALKTLGWEVVDLTLSTAQPDDRKPS